MSIDACPAERTKRSRSIHWESAGSCFMTRVNSAYVTGARAIGVPGWPEFAFWTASIESVRIVSIESFSRLDFSVSTDIRLLGGREGWLASYRLPTAARRVTLSSLVVRSPHELAHRYHPARGREDRPGV